MYSLLSANGQIPDATRDGARSAMKAWLEVAEPEDLAELLEGDSCPGILDPQLRAPGWIAKDVFALGRRLDARCLKGIARIVPRSTASSLTDLVPDVAADRLPTDVTTLVSLLHDDGLSSDEVAVVTELLAAMVYRSGHLEDADQVRLLALIAEQKSLSVVRALLLAPNVSSERVEAAWDASDEGLRHRVVPANTFLPGMPMSLGEAFAGHPNATLRVYRGLAASRHPQVAATVAASPVATRDPEIRAALLFPDPAEATVRALCASVPADSIVSLAGELLRNGRGGAAVTMLEGRTAEVDSLPEHLVVALLSDPHPAVRQRAILLLPALRAESTRPVPEEQAPQHRPRRS